MVAKLAFRPCQQMQRRRRAEHRFEGGTVRLERSVLARTCREVWLAPQLPVRKVVRHGVHHGRETGHFDPALLGGHRTDGGTDNSSQTALHTPSQSTVTSHGFGRRRVSHERGQIRRLSFRGALRADVDLPRGLRRGGAIDHREARAVGDALRTGCPDRRADSRSS